MAPKKEPRQNGQQIKDLAPQLEDEKTVFSHCDLHLLESGEHADISLMCADRVFHCHRAILAARSGWFKEKIDELNLLHPQDGSLSSLHIQNPGPDDTHAVLLFIYAGDVDPRAKGNFGEPTEPVIKANIRLFNLGHDFRVKGLADFASDAIGKNLSSVLHMICDPRLTEQRHPNGRTELQDRLRKTDFIRTFIDGLEAADWIRGQGADENERVRPWQMLVDFFIAGEEVLLQEPEIALFLEADVVPSFAKSYLLTKRRDGHCRSKWMRGLVARPPKAKNAKRGKCCDCNKDVRKAEDIARLNPRSMRICHDELCCVECAEKESNCGVDGFKWEAFGAKKH